MSEEENEGKTFIDPANTNKTTLPPPNNNEEKKKDGMYILIIVLLLIGAGVLGYMLSEKNKAVNVCVNERTELQAELDAMNELMVDEGLAMGDNVKQNLQNMLTMYNQMEGDNAEMNDSIAAQKEKITKLMDELEAAKRSGKISASQVYKLRKETETLRSIMKDYIRTIDSLNTANGVLTESLNTTLLNLDNMTEQKNQVQKNRDELADKVNAGSKLNAFAFLTEGIRERGSGSYREVDRASRCTHIRSCFSLGENAIAEAGNKTIYMRIITPGGSVLNSSNSNTLKTEGGQSLLYSDKKVVNYQNKAIDLCIFYELTGEIEEGNYIAEIYAEGVKIGTDNFVLK
jgi:hypothetical protein